MGPSRQPSWSSIPAETQTGPAELKNRITEACEFWPESSFYLQQLSCYIKPDTPLSPGRDKAPTAEVSTFVTPATLDARTPRLSQVVVAEGHLSPESVIELASQHANLPLEFFLGHLELERVWKLFRTSYELPALPSRRGHIVHVRLPTLWRCNDSVDSIAAVYPEDRAEADTLCMEYEKRLLDGGEAGATRFRKVHMHNWKRFTVEQVASLCLIPEESEEGAWIAVYALDSGKPLSLGSEPFPRNGTAPLATAAPTLQPTVRYNETVRRRGPTPPRSFNGGPGTFSMHPYHPYQDLGGEAELSPFLALASLLGAASASWNQVLNFIDEDIEVHQDVTTTAAPAALAQVRFNLGLVHRFQGIIQQDLEALSGDSIWQGMRPADFTESGSTTSDDFKAPGQWGSLTRDYESLLTRCRSLSRRCESASQVLQSTLMQLEHQKSRVKADEVNRLTMMGLFFFPSSLVAAIFSIGVAEMDGPSKPRLWHFILAEVVAVSLCWAVYYSHHYLERMRHPRYGKWAQTSERRGSASPKDRKLKEP